MIYTIYMIYMRHSTLLCSPCYLFNAYRLWRFYSAPWRNTPWLSSEEWENSVKSMCFGIMSSQRKLGHFTLFRKKNEHFSNQLNEHFAFAYLHLFGGILALSIMFQYAWKLRVLPSLICHIFIVTILVWKRNLLNPILVIGHPFDPQRIPIYGLGHLRRA